MQEPWTARRMLGWIADDFRGRGIESARLEAELLVADALGLDRLKLYLDLERPISDPELGRIRGAVQRRRAREPLAYVRGRREFYGRAFAVNRHVLVPRPETELLVERVLALFPKEAPPPRVLDLCTGSGCVGVTVALERPGAEVVITDVSPEALRTARENAAALGASVDARAGDLFGAVEGAAPFDVVVANPPYVTAAELEELAPEVRDHEPRLALVADEDGLAVLRRIAEGAGPYLRPVGSVLVEHGETQGDRVRALFDARGAYDPAVTHRDLAGHPRVTEARLKVR